MQSIHYLPPNSMFTSCLKPCSLSFLQTQTQTQTQHNKHKYKHNKDKPTSLFNLNTTCQKWSLFAAIEEDGPIEISPNVPSIFATNDDPTPLQVSTSVLLTGAISVFLFRAVRRRAKRAKELKMRSSGAKSLKEEALDSLKAVGAVSIEPKATPSPVQAFLGAISAGVIALILYKFTTTIEASLNRQTLSDSYSVRQITVTIRTIINGLCYLATFVFGMNSIGLLLYSGQLALNSISESPADSDGKTNDEKQSSSSNVSTESPGAQENKDTDQTS